MYYAAHKIWDSMDAQGEIKKLCEQSVCQGSQQTAAKIALGIDVLPMTKGRPHGLTKFRRVSV